MQFLLGFFVICVGLSTNYRSILFLFQQNTDSNFIKCPDDTTYYNIIHGAFTITIITIVENI